MTIKGWPCFDLLHCIILTWTMLVWRVPDELAVARLIWLDWIYHILFTLFHYQYKNTLSLPTILLSIRIIFSGSFAVYICPLLTKLMVTKGYQSHVTLTLGPRSNLTSQIDCLMWLPISVNTLQRASSSG